MSSHVANKLASGQKLRIFVTGATGNVGRAVTSLAVSRGHSVVGLSRGVPGDENLRGLGATPVRGDMDSLEVLRAQAEAADAVVHLAWDHSDFSAEGAARTVARDVAGVDALCRGVRGTDKPLVAASGTAFVASDPRGQETDEESPVLEEGEEGGGLMSLRLEAERNLLRKHNNDDSDVGGSGKIRGIVVRLAPYVYGRGIEGFLTLRMRRAAELGESAYPAAAARNRVTTLHVDDCAAAFLAAVEKGRGGQIYNAGNHKDHVGLRDMCEAIAEVLSSVSVSSSEGDDGPEKKEKNTMMPVRAIETMPEALETLGPLLAGTAMLDVRVSSRKAREELGWEARAPRFLADVTRGSYVEVARRIWAETKAAGAAAEGDGEGKGEKGAGTRDGQGLPVAA